MCSKMISKGTGKSEWLGTPTPVEQLNLNEDAVDEVEPISV